ADLADLAAGPVIVEPLVADDLRGGSALLDPEGPVAYAEPAGDEGRHRQIDDLAAVERENGARQPGKVGPIDRLDLNHRLDTAIAQLSPIEELGGEAGRGGQGALEQEVGDVFLVEGQLRHHAIVEADEIDTGLDLVLALRLDLGVAGDADQSDP